MYVCPTSVYVHSDYVVKITRVCVQANK